MTATPPDHTVSADERARAAALAAMRRDFPAYDIQAEPRPEAAPRYTARRLDPGPGLYLITTADLAEMRRELSGHKGRP